jgi:hypothetical protein
MRRVVLVVFQIWMPLFFVLSARRAPSGAHARAYIWLTGGRSGTGARPAEDGSVLLPQATRVRLRNTRRLNMKTKRA